MKFPFAANLPRIFLFSALICSVSICRGAAATSKPDILLIMPDQMRGDCLSALKHPVVRTPHLDELSRQGTLFRRGYSTCPSCIPARYSLLTGLYPSTSGVVGFKGKPIPSPTLPKMLNDAGYTTILAGRCMHQTPADESYGYQKIIRGSTYVSDDDYDAYLKHAAPESGGLRKLVATLGVSFNRWQAKPWPLAEELHPTAWAVQQARESLKTAPVDKPLFLTASFFAPHPPLFPPKRYFDEYFGRKLPQPAHGDWVDYQALSPKGNPSGDRILLEGEALRATEAGYFGQIEHLDDQIAPLIAEFKERSEKAGRSWVIVFTSDHGEMLGDNGYFRKCEPYEGSANIPFVIAGSATLGFKRGTLSQELVCLEDLMPTLLDLAGEKCPQPMDGISLVPALRGDKKTLREMLHLEHAVCYNKQQAFQALTDKRFKYIWRTLDGTEQLFDLKHDPREEHDLSKDPEHRKQLEEWRARMVQLLAHRPEGFSDGTKLIAGRPYPPLQAKPGQ